MRGDFEWLPSVGGASPGMCPDLLPPLHVEGPLCVPEGATVVEKPGLGVVAVTYWCNKSDLTEGPPPGIWIAHFYIREGNWRLVELGAMDHSSEARELTVMYHDTKAWHALGNRVMARQYEWVFADYRPLVWPGCEVGVVFRDLWWAEDDILFIGFALEAVGSWVGEEVGSDPVGDIEGWGRG